VGEGFGLGEEFGVGEDSGVAVGLGDGAEAQASIGESNSPTIKTMSAAPALPMHRLLADVCSPLVPAGFDMRKKP
jgi:hypothetical protein